VCGESWTKGGEEMERGFGAKGRKDKGRRI